MKNILVSLLLSFPIILCANPKPFGLEIGKATITDVKDNYSTSSLGINKYSNGPMYELAGIEMDGLEEITIIFDKSGKLAAVLTVFRKSKFDFLLDSLSKKYELYSKKVPFVGSKSATLVDGDVEITLDAPHMSFKMKLNYISNSLLQKYQQESTAENQKQREREQAQL